MEALRGWSLVETDEKLEEGLGEYAFMRESCLHLCVRLTTVADVDSSGLTRRNISEVA